MAQFRTTEAGKSHASTARQPVAWHLYDMAHCSQLPHFVSHGHACLAWYALYFTKEPSSVLLEARGSAEVG